MKAINRFWHLSTAGRHELGDQIISSAPLRPLKVGSENYLSIMPNRERTVVCKEMTLKELVGDASGVVLVCEDSLLAGDNSEIRMTVQELDRLISLAIKWREAYSQAQGQAPGVTWVDLPLPDASACSMCGDPARRGIQVQGEDTVLPFCGLCQEYVRVVESGGKDEEDRPGPDALPTLAFCQIHVPVKKVADRIYWCAGRHLVVTE